MQYLHQATYGHAGGLHTLRPQFVMKGGNIYKSQYHADVVADHSEGLKAIYKVEGNNIYSTALHPQGRSAHPLFHIDGDKIHTTVHNPEHDPAQHVWELQEHP